MIKLAQPDIPESAIEQMVAVLRSGNLVQGKHVREFEEVLQAYLEIEHVVLVSSGTAALHLALVALGIGPSDEIIVPAFTFPATANVVEIVGARPVLVDITLDDFCIDPEEIAKRITKKTRAIMPVHEFGQCADMDRINEIAVKHGLLVIEDAACALGSEFKGKKAGTLGDIGCFSLHPRKAITTGEGGVVVTSDGRLAEKIRALRNHGISTVDGRFDFIHAGFNYRLTEFQAVLGLHQLHDLEVAIGNRNELADLYENKLGPLPGIRTPRKFPLRRMTYQTYHVLIANEYSRDRIVRFLKSHDVESNLGAQAIHCLTYYRNKYQFKDNDFPNAQKSFCQGLALPMSHILGPSDVITVCSLLQEFFKDD